MSSPSSDVAERVSPPQACGIYCELFTYFIFSTNNHVSTSIIKCHPLRENCIVSLCMTATTAIPRGTFRRRRRKWSSVTRRRVYRVSKARRRIAVVAALLVVDGISRTFRRPLFFGARFLRARATGRRGRRRRRAFFRRCALLRATIGRRGKHRRCSSQARARASPRTRISTLETRGDFSRRDRRLTCERERLFFRF